MRISSERRKSSERQARTKRKKQHDGDVDENVCARSRLCAQNSLESVIGALNIDVCLSHWPRVCVCVHMAKHSQSAPHSDFGRDFCQTACARVRANGVCLWLECLRNVTLVCVCVCAAVIARARLCVQRQPSVEKCQSVACVAELV